MPLYSTVCRKFILLKRQCNILYNSIIYYTIQLIIKKIMWIMIKCNLFSAKNECLVLARKERCRNSLERRTRRRNFRRRCEINFLPLVFLDTLPATSSTSHVHVHKQMLRCRSDDLTGYGSCPERTSTNETLELFCDSLRDNTKRCELEEHRIHTSCRVMEVCDQAVLISGGWNLGE